MTNSSSAAWGHSLPGLLLVAGVLCTGVTAAQDLPPRPPFDKTGSGLSSVEPSLVAQVDRLANTPNLPGLKSSNNTMVVEYVTALGDEAAVAEWLEYRGASRILTGPGLVQADVHPEAVRNLDEIPLVKSVRSPTPLLPTSFSAPRRATTKTAINYQTEGLSPMNAPAWHSAGYRGDGVKVGIIGFGFSGYSSLLGGELPSSTMVHYRSFTGWQSSIIIGTATAEIVHDVAPGAELYLGEIETETEFYAAINWMQTNGVDVVVTDLSIYPLSPGDGTGTAQQTMNGLFASGILPVSGSGNFRINHWQGRFYDSDGDGWHNFSAGDEANNMTSDGVNWMWSPPGVSLVGAMVWNEWDLAVTDLDICVIADFADGNGPQLVECFNDAQNGTPGQLPREINDFVTPSYGYYAFAIFRYAGTANPDIEVFLYRLDAIPEYRVADGSLAEPSDAVDLIAVSAIDASSGALEPFSSRGPTNGPGGSLSYGQVKPDLAGYDHVSTATGGVLNLYGAGTAAAHVAGAAALVWSAHPDWSVSQVRSYLYSNAIERGPTGKDNDYGYGALYLGAPPVACSYSLSPTSRTHTAEAGSGTISVSTSSGCTWTAASNNGWIHITAGTTGSGNGSISYSVDANPNTAQRTGTITAAGTTFTVVQAAAQSCSYSLSPTSASFPAEGGTGTVNVTANSGCAWSASATNSWISVTSGSTGSGSGAVGYTVTSNPNTTTRDGSITIAGQTFTVNQAAATACSYSVSPASASFSSAGGSGNFSVSTSTGCAWTATSSNAWIAITSGRSGSGNGVVNYVIGSNSTANPRSGSISVGDTTYSINQQGQQSDGATYMVAGIAHAPGAAGSTWRSTLSIMNPGSDVANIALRYLVGAWTVDRSVSIGAGRIVEWEDVAVSLFGQTQSTSGAVKIQSDREVIVTARTYNETDNGTFGQYLPGATHVEGLGPDGIGVLPQIKKGTAFRTNIGFVNCGTAPVTVETKLFSESGARLGAPVSTVVGASEWKQENDIFDKAGVAHCTVGYATVDIVGGEGPIWAYASVVDNTSGDPTTIPVFVR